LQSCKVPNDSKGTVTEGRKAVGDRRRGRCRNMIELKFVKGGTLEGEDRATRQKDGGERGGVYRAGVAKCRTKGVGVKNWCVGETKGEGASKREEEKNRGQKV